MKKCLAILMAVLMLIGLVACGPSTPDVDKPDTTQPKVDTPETDATEPDATDPPQEPWKSSDPNYGTV
ncbi:MAG: hypothetical protein ACOYH4_03720, partial [Saccharofermentanales bacterium]